MAFSGNYPYAYFWPRVLVFLCISRTLDLLGNWPLSGVYIAKMWGTRCPQKHPVRTVPSSPRQTASLGSGEWTFCGGLG